MRRWFCVFLIFAITLSGCSGKTDTNLSWQEHYDLGIRYLSEGNYEEAIIAFTAAIEIDPKHIDSYQKAAEAYIALGDYSAAQDILESGYDATGDSSFEGWLADIQSKLSAELTSQSAADSRSWAIKDFISPLELTIGGTPFFLIDIQTAKDIFPGDEPQEITERDGNLFYVPVKITGNTIHSGSLGMQQALGSNALYAVTYSPHPSLESDYMFQPEFRGILLNEAITDVLSLLGFTNEGIDAIRQSTAPGGYFGIASEQTRWHSDGCFIDHRTGDTPNIHWEYYDENDPGKLEIEICWWYQTAEQIGAECVTLSLRFKDNMLNYVSMTQR